MISHATATPESVSYNINGSTITGIRHRNPSIESSVRLLCIHGWLDNANSFLPLMPLLPEVDLIAIDLPGHGYSAHIGGSYSVPDMMFWVAAVAKAAGWDQYHLAGHSLGGCIAPLVAVASPDNVQSLIMIESSGSMSAEADAYPERLKKALRHRMEPEQFQPKPYKDKQDAVNARLRAAKMNPISARLIIDRQVKKVDEGWVWRFDPKLRMATPQYQTEAQVQAVLAAIPCETLTILAGEGFLSERENTHERLSLIQDHKSVTLMGHHHLHMDTPDPVSTAMNQFLGTRPHMGG